MPSIFSHSRTGQLLLTKDARSLAVEFPSVFMRIEELCNSKDDEQHIKDLNFIVRFEEQISKQLKQVIQTTSHSTMQIGGNMNGSVLFLIKIFTRGHYISKCYSCKHASIRRRLQPCTSVLQLKIAQKVLDGETWYCPGHFLLIDAMTDNSEY